MQWLPAEDGCQDCVTALQKAVAPGHIPWTTFREKLSNPDAVRSLNQWRLLHAGLPTDFKKSDVSEETAYEVTWIDSHIPKTAVDLQADYPNKKLPEDLPWCDIPDGHGQNQHVVLVYQGSRVEISHKTTAHMATKVLSADHQLRAKQGEDAFQAARKRSEPPKHLTPEQLQEMMQPGTPPDRPAPEDELLHSLLSGKAAGPGPQAASGLKRSRTLRGIGSNPKEPEGKQVRSGKQVRAQVEELITLTPPTALQHKAAVQPHTAPTAREAAAAAAPAAAAAAAGAAAEVHHPSETQQPCGKRCKGKGQARNPGGARGSRRTVRRECEVELNLMNILAGKIERPRVEVYNRRQRVPGLAKQAHESEVIAEELQIKVLESAINFCPAEIRNCDQKVLEASVKVCDKSVRAYRWPKETILGLIRRAAMACLESPEKFLKIAWPISGANSPADTVNFDPVSPRLSQNTECVSMDEKYEALELMIVKDFMPIVLKKGQAGMPILVEMAASFEKYFTGPATGANTNRIRDLRTCVLGLSALAKQTTITPDEFEAFEAVDQAKLTYGSELGPCLADGFWQERRTLLWNVAAYESTTHAILQQTVATLTQGPPLNDDGRQAMEEAWTLSQNRWPSWTENMRLGALQPLAEALAQQLVSEASTMQVEAMEASVALARAKTLDARASWLAEVMPSVAPRLQDSQRTLRSAMTGWDAQVRMSKGNQLLREMAVRLDSSEKVTTDMVAKLRAEYDGCLGICPPAEITDDLKNVLEFLAAIELDQLESNHAWLAVRISTLLLTASSSADSLGAESSSVNSPGARPSQETTDNWTKTAKGLELQEALAASTRGDSRITALAEKLESLHQQSGEVLESFRDHLQTRVKEARREITAQEKSEWDSIMADAQSYLTELADKAGGAPGTPGGSWKAALSEDSSWEDVQREAKYHLFKHDPTSKEDVAKDIENTHNNLTKALELLEAKDERIKGWSLEAAPARPEGFSKKIKDTTHLAKATLMEIKFLKAMSEAPGVRSKKIKERVTSMSRHHLAPEHMQPALWTKVFEEMRKDT